MPMSSLPLVTGLGAEMPKKDTRIVLKDLIDAWESLPGGETYSSIEVGRWLERKMKPAFDKARRHLGLTIPTKKRELDHDK